MNRRCLHTWSLKIMHMLENSSIPTAGIWLDLQISIYDLLSCNKIYISMCQTFITVQNVVIKCVLSEYQWANITSPRVVAFFLQCWKVFANAHSTIWPTNMASVRMKFRNIAKAILTGRWHVWEWNFRNIAKAILTGRWHDKSVITCWCWGRHSMLFTTTGLNTFDKAVSIWSNVTCKNLY
jgi:hypothetical protein